MKDMRPQGLLNIEKIHDELRLYYSINDIIYLRMTIILIQSKYKLLN